MKLIFIRHGQAEKKKESNSSLDDFRRLLTNNGVVEVKEVVQSLPFLFKKVNVIYSSPMVRALQTAEIISSHIPKANFDILSSLDSESTVQSFAQDLGKMKNGVYCFVGHEPHLSQAINYLLNGQNCSAILMRKAGIVVLDGQDIKSLKISSVLSPHMILRLNNFQ